MRRRIFVFGLVVLLGIGAGLAYWIYGWYFGALNSNGPIRQWLTDTSVHDDFNTPVFTQCPGAPFIIPSEGFIGLLWNDPSAPYTPLRRHTGIDIFGVGMSGSIPIYAAYDGLLSRPESWLSTVIIQHEDPLQAGRTIWTYYTHMANRSGTHSFIAEDFPRGTYGVPVEQGTLLGYQGEYAGNAAGIAMHLHISIVLSNPDGSFKNEAVLANTLDPSPYFGMKLDATQQRLRPVTCAAPN